MRSLRGFTLLEMLIALAVVSITMLAITETVATQTRLGAELERDMAARWVASNVLELSRATEPWPDLGPRAGEMVMGRATWYWRMDVRPSPEPDMRRLEVQVFADPEHALLVGSLTGFAGRLDR